MRKYEEVVGRIKRDLASGRLRRGTRLPSIRDLTLELACSPNTVIKAYQQLEQEHLIYSVPRSGHFVVDGLAAAEPGENEAGGAIDFLEAGPDIETMPYRDFQHSLNKAIELYREELFVYSDLQGMLSLRIQLARQLRDVQVFTVPERICVTTGSQQAIHLLAGLPFPNGKRKLVVEQPTHAGMLESIRQLGLQAEGIEVGKEGIDLDALERLFAAGDVKLFYAVSRFHNPTGYSHTNEQRGRIVELARRYDVYVLEDDYLGDLDADKKQDPMFAHDPSGRVIYVKSFSKIMLPGLRLGLAVLPDELREPFLRAKSAADVHTPVLMQGALEIYLASGMFDAHAARLQAVYRRKAELLAQACRRMLPDGILQHEPRSGFYAQLVLPDRLRAERFKRHMEAKGVLVGDASGMFLPAFARNDTVRLSLSRTKGDAIEEGIRLIGEGLRELRIADRRSVAFRT